MAERKNQNQLSATVSSFHHFLSDLEDSIFPAFMVAAVRDDT